MKYIDVKIVISILLLTATCSVDAQESYKTVLEQVETNNTTLQVLRKQMEAQQIDNRTGLAPDNPEVEFNYLWGNPSAIGNRTDIKVSQSFDFPTAYGYRKQISRLENANAGLVFKSERINLLLQVKQTCIELIYYNALAKEYAFRLKNAEQLAVAYQTSLEKGGTNAIENNKAQMNLVGVRNEVAYIETERTMLLAELKRLNGDREITYASSNYPRNSLPPSFEEWYIEAEKKSPVLEYLSGQIRISKAQIKLNRAMGLPKLSAGYLSEKVVGEQFQGITLGASIPLWENRNRVRHAKAQVKVAELTLDDTKMQFYNQLQKLYMKALNLQESVLNYRNALTAYSNEDLLKKALDAGELSLLSYLQELSFYYEAVDKGLEAEKDFELSLAELSAVEL